MISVQVKSESQGSALQYELHHDHMKAAFENGDGVIEKGTDDEQQCPTCGGSGYVPDDDDDNYEEIIKTSAC
jgi:hypothetical protein